ncbi:hypothetical protein HUL18_004657 [Salmonella enterica]|uniref:Ead/Ea22-like family protein n=1 Tax=Salmonella enterica TaxID=28901 RepID=A0A5Z4LBF6_SALER|nr:hypothetical protein [Salmonella enterica]EEH4961375.1 hypothetical protein [Salmonella enterica subsp. enterica serovar Javiana]EBK6652736.1 hypothetical protein [Salmonella enterica]EBL8960301.1 hypothetical protein [Salmonella enterica]ECE5060890.1 hypothetical protein [Salmonella enterica]
MKERGITDGLTMNQLAERNAEHVATIAALEARYAALAAENAGLKAAIDSTIGWQQSTDPVNVESVRMLVDIETPETDAFLAEVRAQGADELAELYFTLAAHEANRYIADSWRESARFAKDYAVQIRKGAAQ